MSSSRRESAKKGGSSSWKERLRSQCFQRLRQERQRILWAARGDQSSVKGALQLLISDVSGSLGQPPTEAGFPGTPASVCPSLQASSTPAAAAAAPEEVFQLEGEEYEELMRVSCPPNLGVLIVGWEERSVSLHACLWEMSAEAGLTRVDLLVWRWELEKAALPVSGWACLCGIRAGGAQCKQPPAWPASSAGLFVPARAGTGGVPVRGAAPGGGRLPGAPGAAGDG